MTTIIVDRRKRIMAADRQTTYGSLRVRSTPKIRRYRNKKSQEALVASAGSSEAGIQFDNWFKEQFLGKEEKEPSAYPIDTDVSGIVLLDNGDCFLYLSKGQPIDIKDRFIGVGSGSEYAIGAMHAGATIQQAIKICAKLDNGTGRGIQIEGFTKKRRKRRNA